MCPGGGYGSLHPRRSHSRAGSSGLWCGDDEDEDHHHHHQQQQPQQVVEDSSDDDYDEEEDELERLSRRRSRGIFLHSYPFSRKLSLQDRFRASIRRCKKVAWGVMACGHLPSSNSSSSISIGGGVGRSSKLVLRKLKDKIKRCCGCCRRDSMLCFMSCKSISAHF